MAQDPNYFLKAGPQTQITPVIQNLVNSFDSTDFQLVFEIFDWIEKNIEYRKLQGGEKLNIFTPEPLLK